MAPINKPVIFIIGGPGSGKGTQCERIVARYGFTHLSTGDLLRDEVKSGSERGTRLSEIMKSGQLVSLDEVLGLLKDAIVAKSESSNGFLIDGYPREVEQAIRFEADICPAACVIYFDATDATMTARLLDRGKSSGRSDDNEETIKKRLDTFHAHSDPIIKHFGPGRCHIVPAERSTDDIFADVCRIIETDAKVAPK